MENFGDKNRFLTNRAIKEIATDQSFAYFLSIDQHLEFIVFISLWVQKHQQIHISEKSAKQMVLI